jgi:hypothetical protein
MESRDLEFEHIGDPTSTSNKLHKSMNVDSNLRAILESLFGSCLTCTSWKMSLVIDVAMLGVTIMS